MILHHMAIAPIHPRIFRVELDHLEQATDSVKALTVDPLNSILHYTAPFFGAWLNSHQELRSTDPLQTQLIDFDSSATGKTQVDRLLSKAGIGREVVLYVSDNYCCRSYGGYCSLTSPIISIPRSFLTKQTESIFEPEAIAQMREIPLDPNALGELPPPTLEEKERALAELRLKNAAVLENIVEEEAPVDLSKWRFTADEVLFFIAREIANIKSNNPFIRIVSKVIFVAALFFISQLAMPVIFGSVFIAAAVTLHIIAERVLRSHLDVDAVQLLEAYFLEHDHEQMAAEDVQVAKTRAYEAGRSAIDKLIFRNTQRRERNELCRLYITPEGNNIIDLVNPFLTSRMNQLEEYRNEQNLQ